MLSRTARAKTTSRAVGYAPGCSSWASENQLVAVDLPASMSAPESPSHVFTKAWTSSSGTGAGFVSSAGTQEGNPMSPSVPSLVTIKMG